MEIREDRDSRYSCKLCNKKYTCGKSLGGHMKSHVVAVAKANSGELDERFEPNFKKLSSLNAEKSFEFGGPSTGYGLRENPKKTWRAVDSSDFSLPQEKVCKQCGKGFQSLKALCGHMACHSEKDRVLKNDHSWVTENLIMDNHSDTEGEDPKRLTRSKSKIYKKVVLKSPSFTYNTTNGDYNYGYDNNNNAGSSSVSEIDEQEQQEEVALCLMMLSRDSSNWGGVNSIVDSSDNNSVVLETKSSSIDMRIISRHDQTTKIKNIGGNKLRPSTIFESNYNVRVVKSSSGYLRNGHKKVGLDISVDELNKVSEFKNPRDDIVEKIKRESGYENGYKKDFVREKLYNEAAVSSSWSQKKRSREEEEEESSTKTIKGSSFDVEPSKNFVNKQSKYECLNCNRTFNSYQALGGHRPCHKKMNNFSPSSYANGETKVPNSLIYKKPKSKDLSINNGKRYSPKKIKGHECPICFRMFKSGQALGGHKRSHFIGGYDPLHDRNKYQAYVNNKQDHDLDSRELIDLNLPAPEEDSDDEYGHFI